MKSVEQSSHACPLFSLSDTAKDKQANCGQCSNYNEGYISRDEKPCMVHNELVEYIRGNVK